MVGKRIVREWVLFCFSVLVLIGSVSSVFRVGFSLVSDPLVVPVFQERGEDPRIWFIVRQFGVSKRFAEELVKISEEEGVDPLFVVVLFWTESNLRHDVMSVKGYYGVSQVPWRLPWVDVQILAGVRVFKEKYRKAKGDLVKAVYLYKGYELGSGRGRKQVGRVFSLYNELKKRYREFVRYE